MAAPIKYTIRRARRNDLKPVFLLSNDISVRRQSINPRPINWSEHVEWFSARLKASDYIFFVVYSRQKQFIAQVRYEIQNASAVVSISIQREFRGKGLAVPLLHKTASRVFRKKPEVKRIRAYIKPENQASSRSFIKAGYMYRNDEKIGSITYNIFILKRPV